MPKLLESLKVKVIEYSDLRISGADALAERVGEGERLCFMRAVAALQEYFARNDEQLYKSIQVNWERLKQAPIFISEHLSVEVAIPGLEHVHSDIRAHVVTSPLTFYFKCHADVGEKMPVAER